MSSDSDNTDNNSNINTGKKYCHTKKKFQQAWLDDKRYNKWLKSISHNEYKCKCFVCNVELICGTTELNRHANSQKHIRKMNSYKSTPSIAKFTKANENSDFNEKVKTVEIGLCAFFAEHNVAISIVEHLVPVLKNLIDDSQIVKALTLGRTKCTGIIKNILGKVASEDIIEELKESKYSIMIDESTDVSDKKSLCILVRYKTIHSPKINTNLLELVELNSKDCSAEVLFNEIKHCLESKGIPLKNMVGVSSDGAAVMVGHKNSVFSRLKKEVPNLVQIHCICHSSALVASKACQELPKSPESLLRNISTYISGSSKRCAILTEFQEYFNLEQHKILKLSTTRWLSMLPCVNRLLENWSALKEFFRLAVFEDNLEAANSILQYMDDPVNKIYLFFLSYVLQYFNAFNALFQSRDVLVHQLYERSSSILTRLCSNFIQPEKIYQCHTLNLKNPAHFISLNQVNIGHSANQMLIGLTESQKFQIRTACLNFYIKAATEIQERLPFENLFQQFKFLDPNYALYLEKRDNSILNLTTVCEQFSTLLDVSKIDMQWQILPVTFSLEQKQKLLGLKVDEFWHEVSIAKDHNDSYLFFELCTLANIVMILPHSNAEAERVFSMVTDVKTKKRNRLAMETLNAMTVFRSSLQNKNLDCTQFKVTKKHLQLHNNTNIY